uniref:NADH dehydrogenase subunit 6 n=1 Tax=Pleonexes koreana TaxID=2663336 RepID=A0A5P9W7V5_9CRUS|nr:NADH dehydrogenase subunit 6 [Pleonexes koreana]
MLTLTAFLYLMTIFFIITNHPLMMGFSLMITSMIYGYMMYLLNSSSWLVYILIMVFVSGVMVMFIYMASLSSNEPMNLPLPLFWKINMMIFTLMPFFILTKQLKTNYTHIGLMNMFFKQCSMNLIYKTYNKIMLEMTTLLTIYLLIVLIVAMKLVNNFKLPLRSKK